MMNLQAIAECLGCAPVMPIEIHSIGIDSRTVTPGQLFVALRGERFDGHDFVTQAVVDGAVAVICERELVGLTVPQLVVQSSLQALSDLAIWHRSQVHCPVIALTGSNGKTSVKEMIASILPQPAYATRGNRNNHIGVPLSVLDVLPTHRYAVFELGANHLGEIAYTVNMVKPDVALINNIAPAHVEGFGSIEGVARAKGEIYQGLAPGATAVVNDDDHYAHFWDDLIKSQRVLRFSLQKPAHVFCQSVTYNEHGCATFELITPEGKAPVQLNVPGEHMVRNALAAASCTLAVGISVQEIAAGLEKFTGVAGRLTFKSGKNDSLVIDDTYNANLRSVLTAIDVLAKRKGRRILVLGDMGELGDYSQAHHEEIGQAARNKGIEMLMTCGQQSVWSSKAFGGQAQHFDSQDALSKELLACLDKETTVLVKGSRSAAMEKIVQQLVL